MSVSIRCGLLMAALAAVVPRGARAEEHGEKGGDVIALSVGEPKQVNDRDASPPFLARELVRQAFLIAARDEWGLSTRDASLREQYPDAHTPHEVPFEVFCTVRRVKGGFNVRYTLNRRKGNEAEQLGEWTFLTDIFSPKMIIDLADLAERMSRGKFKNVLQEQGLGRPVPPPREFAGVPRDSEARLWEWNELTVLAGLRQIHAEIHAKGESPELVAGLAVGYANLATLTSYYYSPAHKAFAARALLYAERLVHEAEGSDWALWHRAYVRAIVGLHDQARADVKSAKKLWDKKSSKPLPFWSDVLEAFCEGQLPRMQEKAHTRKQQRLARYLFLQAVMCWGLRDVSLKAGRAVLEECPDCLLAADRLCALGQIGPLAEVTGSSFPRLSAVLRSRLPEVPGFPPSLTKRLRETKAPAPNAETGFEDEIEFRNQLLSDVKAVATSGRDRLEPSLAVLGQMIEEIQFSQVMRRLQLEGSVWGVPVDQTIATFRPLCARHRYAALPEMYAATKAETDRGAELLARAIEPSELGLPEHWFLDWLRSTHHGPPTLWAKIAWSHADPVFGDEMMGIDQGIAGQPEDRTYNKPHMDMMWQTSSKLPVALAIQVKRNWRRAKFFLATVENDYGEDPILMSALAERYLQIKQYDDAERCAKHKIHSAPDYAAYETLAAVYKAKGDMTRWQETLEKCLELPSMGLEHASVRDTIARYHMERNEWKEAAMYADAAAESYSGWSMATAAQCHEKLGNWVKAEAYMRAISERYATSSLDWMLWCHRTGHGDADAADACARKYFESLGTSFYSNTRDQVAIYYLLRKEPEKALAIFIQSFQRDHALTDAMHAATIADSLGKSAERDELLAKIAEADPKPDPKGAAAADLYKKLAGLFRRLLASGSLKGLDLKEVDAIITGSPYYESPTNLQYFVGMFLKNRGDAVNSREYLIRCAQSQLTNKYTHVLARQTLRDLKIPIPPPPTVESAERKQ